MNDYCHINGGASRVAIDEAVSLAEAGEKVIFFGSNGPICKELQNAPLTSICLYQPELLEADRSPTVLAQALWNAEAYNKMKDLLSRLNKDSTILHLHGYTKSLTTSPVRAAREMGFPVVCTLHDFFAACPNGAFFNYAQNKPCPKQGMSLDCITTNCDKRHYYHKIYRVMRSGVQQKVDHFPKSVMDYITLSNHSAALLKPYLPPDARYYPLENLIEVKKAPPIDIAANSSVVAVGRLDIEKGIEVLLDAALQAGVRLTLIGDGPLHEKAERYSNCNITGWVQPEAVQEELSKARCLVFPSLWYEAYGLVVAEAAARGVPAIVSSISAAAERVTDGVDGWHVEAGNVEKLVGLLTLTKNNETLSKVGTAAYNRFWQHPPTRANHTAGLRSIYSTILSSRK